MAEIRSVKRLREILGEPLPRVVAKDRDSFHPEHKSFLAASPICFLATSAADGTCDVGPKGDPVGSWLVVDDHTLAIPERPGNKRADGLVNILDNPHVGTIFLVPGRGDTLRVNGRARLLDDAPYADELIVKGHRPSVIVEIAVEQIFFHCSKAFLRSELWDPETWHPEEVPSRAEIAHSLERPADSLEEIEAYYSDANYGKIVY